MCNEMDGECQNCKCCLTAKVKNWAERMEILPEAEITRFEIDGFTHSHGLIFNAQFQVSNHLPVDILKWKFAEYHIISHDSEIYEGKIPSKRLKAEETTTVDMIIQIPLHYLKKWWAKIKNTVTDGVKNFQLELVLTLSLPFIGEHSLSQITYEMKVSEAWDKLLPEMLS